MTAAFALALGLACGPARGAPVIHYGLDPGVGPGQAAPIAAAAEAGFLAAAGTTTVLSFESAPLGSFASLPIGSGATVGLSVNDTTPPPGYAYGIAADNPAPLLGYNTTPGGARFLRFAPELGSAAASLTFDFAAPVSAIGLTLTGLGPNSGTLHAIFGPGPADEAILAGDPAGGRLFFGLTGLGDGITRLRLEVRDVPATRRDVFGVDDLRLAALGSAAVTPEPPMLPAALLGVPALASWLRRRRRR